MLKKFQKANQVYCQAVWSGGYNIFASGENCDFDRRCKV